MVNLSDIAKSAPEIPNAKLYIVGGSVRDFAMGLKEFKDVDWAIELDDRFEGQISRAELIAQIKYQLTDLGYNIVTTDENRLTLRGSWPEGQQPDGADKFADFVICREEGPYLDGRRPETVRPADIDTDLNRRDFTINAMAMDCSTGDILDPWDGQADISRRYLRFVGDPQERLAEDYLRWMRAWRFRARFGYVFADGVTEALYDEQNVRNMGMLSVDRRRDEINRMLADDWLEATETFVNLWNSQMRTNAFEGMRMTVTSGGL